MDRGAKYLPWRVGKPPVRDLNDNIQVIRANSNLDAVNLLYWLVSVTCTSRGKAWRSRVSLSHEFRLARESVPLLGLQGGLGLVQS